MSKNAKFMLRVVPIILLDMIVASLCFLAAFILREGSSMANLGPLLRSDQFEPYFSLMVFAPFIRMFTYNLFGVYRENQIERQSAADLVNIAKAVTLGSVILIVITFMYRGVYDYRQFSYSRMVFAYDWVLNLLVVAGTHSIIGHLRHELRRRGLGAVRVAVQGAGEAAFTLIDALKQDDRAHQELVGYIAHEAPEQSPAVRHEPCPYLGSPRDILQIINEYGVDEVVVTNAHHLGLELADFVEQCHKLDVVVKLSLDFYGILAQGRELEQMAGRPVIQVNEIAIRGFARVLKRTEDVVLASFLLMMTLPLWAGIAVAIKQNSPGPILFRQRRVGKNGRTFVMYKFRSMCDDAESLKTELLTRNEAEGHIFKLRNDPRVTPVGRLLRRTNLDEIPQLINVIRGEMSLVGPRPPVPEEVAKYTEVQKRRLGATPGITGLWQVNRSTQHSFEEVLNWDTYYIEHWSLWLDIKILIKTFWVVGNKSSY